MSTDDCVRCIVNRRRQIPCKFVQRREQMADGQTFSGDDSSKFIAGIGA